MRSTRHFASRRLWGLLAGLLCVAVGAAGMDRAARGDAAGGGKGAVDPQAAAFFETQVRPVLASNCYGCHGPAAQMAGLRVDSRTGLLKGGDSGPALVAGDAAKSLLLQVVHYQGKVKMPPSGKMKPEEVTALAAWVQMGAPWPGGEVSAAAKAAEKTGEYVITPQQKRFWSYRPVRKPALPAVKNAAWAASPIDRFVLAKLEAKGLKPSPPADRRTLIRRVTFDLTGLPPTPAEVDAFVRDGSPDAYAKVVDRLLASPRYGERWARHWLDVARYADTKGYVFNEDRNYPNAYTYRDWVIRAFNEDLPYDKFIMQQLAADRLPLGEDRRPLAALGFLTVGRRFLNNPHDIIDDRIDVTTRGFLGVTASCARCHDHKFDPIPTKDYYSLYGVFASSVEAGPVISPRAIADPYLAHDKRVKEAEQAEQSLVTAQVAKLRERLKNVGATHVSPLPDDVKEALQKTRENERPSADALAKLEPAFEAGVPEKLKALRENAAALKKSYPARPEFAMALADAPSPVTPHVFRRGNPGNKGDEVPRRFLQILSGPDRPAWIEGSGRLELARAIASKDNPLTARVMVNRVWLHHFGAGLVRTPSDFGKQGEPPTHPELLDYLAWRFMEGGWSVKKLHRLILLSGTYRQGSDYDPKRFAADPENRLLWRMNRRRLELEALRDSLLYAAGRLDTKAVGGPSVDLWKKPFPARRTLYGFIERQNLPGIFRTFDLSSPDASSPQRFYTTVPQQALFLMNSPFVVEQARALAARPELSARQDDAGRIRYLYYLLYGRVPDAQEVALGLRYVRENAAPAPLPLREESVWSYGYGAFDAAAQRVTSFTPLPHWDGTRWQGGPDFPDPILQHLVLTATGGHAGKDDRHAAIRRWTAPRDGAVAITGTVGHGHAGKGGDGVEARIVSSRAGLLGSWTVHDTKAEVSVSNVVVKKGDTIDFVASCRANPSFDSFTWAPVITLTGGPAAWNANAQFRGPEEAVKPLNGWERYAQALLMTNEFTFVD